MQFAKLSVGDPTVAVGLELDVIAAVIIGGGSLTGGNGTVLGTVLGATIMSVVAIGCSQHGLANWVQQIVTGRIIVLAVWHSDRWRQGSQAAPGLMSARAVRPDVSAHLRPARTPRDRRVARTKDKRTNVLTPACSA
jgi:hypothetical protein